MTDAVRIELAPRSLVSMRRGVVIIAETTDEMAYSLKANGAGRGVPRQTLESVVLVL